MPKNKQQEAQEKRLQRNIRQAKKDRAEVKGSGKKTVSSAKPSGKGGFFLGMKKDAPQTAQQSIPYKEMYRDGICRVTDKFYTKTVQFFDINYQLAQADDKAQIFESYCDFLNYFDSTISVQLTFINQRANMQDFSTVLVQNIAPKRQKLFTDIFAASGIAQKYNCALKRLDYQQEQGLMSSLALGRNQIEIQRGLTTSSTAIFVPFTTCELFQQGQALYYGLNALSNNLIMADRKQLKNPNGLFLGTPGSGKSFSAKREIVNVFLLTDDSIIIADPENEYGPLIRRFGDQGQVIDLSPNSSNYINPLDINLDYSDDENPVTLKSDFVLSLCDLIIGGKDGLSPIEKTIIDRCTRLVYRKYLQDPKPENMPILGDLYELLRKQSEPEAQNIATALEIYVNGSLNVFNHRSNIDMDSHRVLCLLWVHHSAYRAAYRAAP